MAEERARNPYLAIPSESPTKVLAIPNIILQRKIHTNTPPAPYKTRLFFFQNASTCNPIASRYLAKLELTAFTGLSTTFLAKLPSTLRNPEVLVESNLNAHVNVKFGFLRRGRPKGWSF